jgi:Protein of unknown function (DUF4230)
MLERGGMNRTLAVFLALALLIGGVLWWTKRQISPPVESIVASSLESWHEQNRLTAFAARFVTVVTSRKEQMGFAAEKTLIIPAMVRYEVDMAKLSKADLVWDAQRKNLAITLPPMELAGPEFALDETREYKSGAVLMTLTDVEKLLDQANRAKAKADILKQAQSGTIWKMAQTASIRAVAQSFALPLKAAGVEANVKVEFRR